MNIFTEITQTGRQTIKYITNTILIRRHVHLAFNGKPMNILKASAIHMQDKANNTPNKFKNIFYCLRSGNYI